MCQQRYHAKNLFLFSKYRCVHDAAAVGAVLPLALRHRAEAGEPLPRLQVHELTGQEGASIGSLRSRVAGEEECVWPAVAAHVIKTLKQDLFVELMDMMSPLSMLLSAATGRGHGRGEVESDEDDSDVYSNEEEDEDEDEDYYSDEGCGCDGGTCDSDEDEGCSDDDDDDDSDDEPPQMRRDHELDAFLRRRVRS
jgi:hypothetical protein